MMPNKIKKTVTWLVIAACAMFGFSFALVPIYNVFCKITGLNGKVELAASQQRRYQLPDTLIGRQIVIEMDSNLHDNLQVDFTPYHPVVATPPGQLVNTSFTLVNHSDRDLVVQAIPSISPGRYAKYLKKLECFCFEKQPIKKHSIVKMPLRFWLEPEIPEDAARLTLSYTLFDISDTATKE